MSTVSRLNRSSYSFEILMYRIDDGGMDLVQRASFTNIEASGFIKEFSIQKLEDVGMNVQFVVIDTTAYFPRMRPLALFAWPNNGSEPITIRFGKNVAENKLLKRLQFKMDWFKSCVFEFDTAYMQRNVLV